MGRLGGLGFPPETGDLSLRTPENLAGTGKQFWTIEDSDVVLLHRSAPRSEARPFRKMLFLAETLLLARAVPRRHRM